MAGMKVGKVGERPTVPLGKAKGRGREEEPASGRKGKVEKGTWRPSERKQVSSDPG